MSKASIYEKYHKTSMSLKRDGKWLSLDQLKKVIIQFHVRRSGIKNASESLKISTRHIYRLYKQWGETWK